MKIVFILLITYISINVIGAANKADIVHETKNVPVPIFNRENLPTIGQEIENIHNHKEVTVTLQGEPDGIVQFLHKHSGSSSQRCSSSASAGETDQNLVETSKISVTGGAKKCRSPFVSVGQGCIWVNKLKNVSWKLSQEYCEDNNANLVMFRDVAEFKDIMDYLKQISGGSNSLNFWNGANDEADEGNWVWRNGGSVPMGSPFWGTVGNAYTLEPNGGTSQNCGMFYAKGQFFLHNLPCNQSSSYIMAPVCQYYP